MTNDQIIFNFNTLGILIWREIWFLQRYIKLKISKICLNDHISFSPRNNYPYLKKIKGFYRDAFINRHVNYKGV